MKQQPAHYEQDTGVCPLAALRPRVSAMVVALTGGRECADTLRGLGVRPGAEVTVLSGGWGRGPFIVSTGESRVAIGRGMAEKVLVRRMDLS